MYIKSLPKLQNPYKLRNILFIIPTIVLNTKAKFSVEGFILITPTIIYVLYPPVRIPPILLH